MIGSIFHLIFYQPLYNAFIFLTAIIPYHDAGIAVIILTFLVQFIIFPFRHKSVVTQRRMKEIEPEVRKVKEQFKKDKQEQTRQIMALYKAHGVSPFSGILMLLVQLPVFFALYRLFLKGVNLNPSDLYSFNIVPEVIKAQFLGVIDISKSNYILAILAAVTQFFQMKLSMPKIEKSDAKSDSFQDRLSRSMSLQAKYIMPAFIFFIALKFSSAIALYWTAMNVFAIVHEAIVAYKAKKSRNLDTIHGFPIGKH
jgi:YidC/Oxa1 family membrane protein insertase